MLRLISAAPTAPLPPAGLLDGLPEEMVEQARRWERHIVEVLTGLPAGAEKGARGRPEFDSETRTLRQWELAKVAELNGSGKQEHATGIPHPGTRARFGIEPTPLRSHP
ncbi:hypothetical protein GCM10027610_045660 [Dactylosporangium cerinum]